ncbi:MAG: T9SS type A sorting domain-containing protein [Bacteroidetes bacterium]|nr:T9SS type A sorting domain-containing protein [Bacteroidota bacterium]
MEFNLRTLNPSHDILVALTAKSSRWGNFIWFSDIRYGPLIPDTARYGFGTNMNSALVLGFDIIPTGVSELSNILGLGLFPNPAPGGRFNVSLDAKQPMKEVSVRISDVTGREVLSRQFSNPGKSLFEEMNLGGAAPGMYFVRITADGETFSRREVVE